MNKTKRKIFEKSMDLFADKGYDSTSIEEITSVVGIAKGTFYYHFPTKESMFTFLIEEGMKLLNNSIEIKTRNLDNVLDKIKEVIIIQVKVSLKYETFVRTVLGQMWGSEERNKVCKRCIQDYIDIIDSILKEGVNKKQINITNTNITAYSIYSLICSCLMNKDKDKLSMEELSAEYLEIVMKLLS